MDVLNSIRYTKARIKSLDLLCDEHDGTKKYFLKAIWEYETDYGRYELIIPNIRIPIFSTELPVIAYERYGVDKYQLVSTTGYLPIDKDEHSFRYCIKELEPYRKEMTLEEIEKQLGYKIKLVERRNEE